MAQVIGQRSTSQAITETRLIRQVDAEIGMLEPNIAPLITFMMKMGKRQAVKSPRIEWLEDDYTARWAQVDATTVGASTSSTTIGVTDGTLFTVGDVFCIPNAVTSSSAVECARVTGISTNSLTVVRDIGGTGANQIAAGAALRLLGSAYEEGGSVPTPKTTAPATKINYTQIFRTTLDLSKTNVASEQYGAASGERDRIQAKKLKEHKISMNAAALFGVKSENLTGGPSGKPIRTTGGLNSVISTNVYDASGMLTQKSFEAFSRMAFRYGSAKKMLLTAPIIKSAINDWGKSYLLVKPGETKLGVDIQEVQTAHGTWMIVRDWMLEDGVPAGNGFGGLAFSIDIAEASYRYLSGNGVSRDTKIVENVIQDGADRFMDEILTEAAFCFQQEKYHAKLYNVTDYAA